MKFLIPLLFLLIGCTATAPPIPTRTSLPPPTATSVPTYTPVPTVRLTPTPPPTWTPIPFPTFSPTWNPSWPTKAKATPNPSPALASMPTPFPEPPYQVDLPAWVVEHFPLVVQLWVGNPPWFPNPKVWVEEEEEMCWDKIVNNEVVGTICQTPLTDIGGYASKSHRLIVFNPNPMSGEEGWDPNHPSHVFLHEYAHLMDSRETQGDGFGPGESHDQHFQDILLTLKKEWDSSEGRLKIRMSSYSVDKAP